MILLTNNELQETIIVRNLLHFQNIDDKISNFRDPCHDTSRNRGAALRICNLIT